MNDERNSRLLALKAAAEKIADPHDDFGRRARESLLQTTGLSKEGIEYALQNCLEWRVSRSTLSGMARSQPQYARAHVLLSANVFVAPFRAIALALCQSNRVSVRASRRAPVFTELLFEASGGAFELLDDLAPQPGDPFWIYGSDETIAQVRRTLAPGVRLHAHGAGMGVAVFREHPHMLAADLPAAVDALAQDTIAFDQRGCLSPRVVLIEGSREFAETVCNLLVQSLSEWEEKVPRGELSAAEVADALRHEATMSFVGSSVVAGMGLVFLDPVPGRVLIPPVGRYLHVSQCQDVLPILKELAPQLTNVSFYNGDHLPGLLRESIGERRYVQMGQMQRPAFDGPVDLRHGWHADVI